MTDALFSTLTQRKYSFAFIGSGPGSMFLAKQIIDRLKTNCLLDFYEKEIYPYGLIRTGVAPDHPQYKRLQYTFNHILSSSNCAYYGNVSISKDISLHDLSSHYSAVIFGNGAQLNNRLNIPNEDAPFVYNSREVANWYNGAIDSIDFKINNQSNNCVIIGNGDVSIDIARILSKQPDDLKHYAFPQKVIEQLKTINHSIQNIYIVARRGFEFSAFTTKQIRELSRLKGITMNIDLNDQHDLAIKFPHLKRKYSIVKAFNQIDNPLKLKSNTKNIIFLFKYIPMSISKGNTNTITFKHALNHSLLNINTAVIIKSIGFQNDFLFNKDVLYENNHIKNIEGNVISRSNELQSKYYSVGWIKGKPSGTIQNTFLDSIETYQSLSSNIEKGLVKEANSKPSSLLSNVSNKIISFKEWTRISDYEIEKGRMSKKEREPIISRNEMLSLL